MRALIVVPALVVLTFGIGALLGHLAARLIPGDLFDVDLGTDDLAGDR